MSVLMYMGCVKTEVPGMRDTSVEGHGSGDV